MKRISLLIVLFTLLVFVLPTFAQDGETPTPDQPTAVAPVATDAPPVVIVTPAPVDTQQVPQWVFLTILVLVLGVITVSAVGILQAAKGIPEWARPILTSTLNSGIDSLDTYAKGTLTTLDDSVVAELRQRILELEAKMNAVPGETARAIQVNNTTQAQNVANAVKGAQ